MDTNSPHINTTMNQKAVSKFRDKLPKEKMKKIRKLNYDAHEIHQGKNKEGRIISKYWYPMQH